MRKIRVMLVDDEEAIRKILRISIPWEKYHMEIAGEADSGSEAINCIDLLAPDLLFVDIKMPFMNGIEFSRIISERYPKLKIIILTAYADFSYAKECIEIKNVLGYLLKPVNQNEIQEYLETFYQDFKTGSPDEKQTENIEEKKEKNNKELIENIQVYIKENYQNCYLNVGAVAEHFGYNANYLGTLYKKSTGQLLSDRIFQVRMERAKELKKADMKMFMVAREVGIEDPFYFSKCFRKYTGMSFSDYQEEQV